MTEEKTWANISRFKRTYLIPVTILSHMKCLDHIKSK